MKIALTTINDVKNFVDAVSRCDFAIDLSSGRYTVDGKSIMGIFSLDLSKPISLLAYTDDPSFAESMTPFTVE
ncbi:MAG: HPr family phosphocarrier protein [Clostridia bacterium]|nr:HPr family phosphocarrier protein [Clostridia bacterium]